MFFIGIFREKGNVETVQLTPYSASYDIDGFGLFTLYNNRQKVKINATDSMGG